MAPCSSSADATRSRPSPLPTPRPHYRLITPALLAEFERRPSPPPHISYIPITLAILNQASATPATNLRSEDASWWEELLQSRNTLVFLGLRRTQSPSLGTIPEHDSCPQVSTEVHHIPSNVHFTDTSESNHHPFVNYSRPFTSSNNPRNQRSFHHSLHQGGDPLSLSHLDILNGSTASIEEQRKEGGLHSLTTNAKTEDYIPTRSTGHLTQPVYAYSLTDSSGRKHHSTSTISEVGSSYESNVRPKDQGSPGGSSGYLADDEDAYENLPDAIVWFKTWALMQRIVLLEREGQMLYPRPASPDPRNEEAEEI